MKISTWISSTATFFMIHANNDTTILIYVDAIVRMSKTAFVDGSVAETTSKFATNLKNKMRCVVDISIE